MMSDEMDSGTVGTVMDFGDIAEQAAATPQFDPSAVKLEGDAVPEDLRGKTTAELIAERAELQRALEASRDSINALRTSQEALTTARQQPMAQAPQAPQAEPEMSSAQLKEMFERDPFEYNQYMLTKMEKTMTRNLESRLAPIASTTASSAEHVARQKFAEEFQVLGKEINDVVRQIPQGQLASPDAWDQVMYYVRGQHMEKLLNARTAKKQQEDLAAARQTEQRNAGVHTEGRRVEGRRTLQGELTPTQKEIIKTLGVTEEDYRKFYA